MAIPGCWSKSLVFHRRQLEEKMRPVMPGSDATGLHQRSGHCLARSAWGRLTRRFWVLSPRNTSLCVTMPWREKS